MRLYFGKAVYTSAALFFFGPCLLFLVATKKDIVSEIISTRNAISALLFNKTTVTGFISVKPA
jgi:positive regulator of sigma E activity